jgi:peptidoglycan-associated lipoprotein
LGEKRANATRDYLERLGVESSRISVISYGEERPQETGQNETAWAKNRRAAFIILSQ